jgi:hypothetical protein
MLGVGPEDESKARRFLFALYNNGVRFSLSLETWAVSNHEANLVEWSQKLHETYALTFWGDTVHTPHSFLLEPFQENVNPACFQWCSETFVRAFLASGICSNAFSEYGGVPTLFVPHYYFRHLTCDVVADIWTEILTLVTRLPLPSVLCDIVIGYFSIRKEFSHSYRTCRTTGWSPEFFDRFYVEPEPFDGGACLRAEPATPPASRYELVDKMIENFRKRKR